MMEEILVCENLTMTFDDGEYIVHALKNVSFSLRKNEVLGIIGESGSGKSTIAKLITGLYQPTGGNIFLGGRSIVRLKRQAQKEVYTKVQMVFQDAVGSFNPRRKIGESISDTLCRLCGEKKHMAGKEAARLLEDVGLSGDYAEKYPHELSGGECQRAAIARAMSVHPEILICDEATSALDVSAQAKIVELLMHLRRIHNVSILFITHDLPLVSNISDRILIMNEGELVEEGSTEEVIIRPKTVYTRRLLDAVC
ncbi:ABC transporter ATP-binding protein [Dialister invisus]